MPALEKVIHDEAADKVAAAPASVTQVSSRVPGYPSPPPSDHELLSGPPDPIARTSGSANGDADSDVTVVSAAEPDLVPVLPDELAINTDELVSTSLVILRFRLIDTLERQVNIAGNVQMAPQDTGFITIAKGFIVDMTIEITLLLWTFASTTGKDWAFVLTRAWINTFVIAPLLFFFAPAMITFSAMGRIATAVYGYLAQDGDSDRNALDARFDAYMRRERAKAKTNGRVDS